MRGRSPFVRPQRRDPEEIKREGWHEQRILVISADDPRLTWEQREMVRILGDARYGKRGRQ